MKPEEFRAACTLLWGDGHSWGVQGASQFLGISERNVKRFGAGEKIVGPGLGGAITEELRRRIFDEHDQTPALVVVRQAIGDRVAVAA